MFGGTVSPKKSLLSRTWRAVCTISICSYIFLEVIFTWHNSAGKDRTICNSGVPFARWTWYAKMAECTIFVMCCILQSTRIVFFQHLYSDSYGTYLVSLCVNLIAGGSSLMTLLFDWGGVCEDIFGVKTPSSLWSEWMVCLPLLYYIALTIEDKTNLTKNETLLIICIELTILFGFLLNLVTSIWLSSLFVILSFVAYFASLYIFYLVIQRYEVINAADIPNNNNIEVDRILYIAHKRMNLAGILVCFTPSFPIAYLLAMSGAVSPDTYLVLILLCNVSTKAVFASVAVDAHLQLSHKGTHLLFEDNIKYTLKSAFFRNILKNTYSPLESIRLGVRRLSATELLLNEEQSEALIMVNESREYLERALRDVLELQDQETAEILLQSEPIIIRDFIRLMVMSFQGEIHKKDMNLSASISPDVPHAVLGDKTKLQYVFANIISNAIKFSEHQTNILLDVDAENGVLVAPPGTSILIFTIKDQGAGIPANDLATIFRDDPVLPEYTLGNELRRADNFGGGMLTLSSIAVRGLAISRQIVELHGGQLTCESINHLGSVFTVEIPFALVSFDSDSDNFERIIFNPRREEEAGGSPFHPEYEPISKKSSEASLGSVNIDTIEAPRHNRSSETVTDSEGMIRFDELYTGGIFGSGESRKIDDRIDNNPKQKPFLPMIINTIGVRSMGSPVISPLRVVGGGDDFMSAGKDAYSFAGRNDRSSFAPDDSLRVLIVDGSIAHGKMLNHMLKRRRCVCEVARDGQHALQLVEGNVDNFDLIVIDAMSEGFRVSGLEVCELLRRRLCFGHIIIGLVESSLSNEADLFLRLGADTTFTKPLNLGVIYRFLQFVYENGNVSRPDMTIIAVEDNLQWVRR